MNAPRRERVLIIVPDSQLRTALSRVLSSSGFVPLVTDSLEAAMMYLTTPLPRAVVFDERLEGGPIPALFELRARAPNAALIAMLTTEDDRGLLSLGVTATMPRLRVLQELVPALRAALSAPIPASAPPPVIAEPVINTGEPESLASTLRAHLSDLEEEDYFGVLGLELDADTRAVRKAFLEHAKEWHPSRYGLDTQDVRAVVADIFIVIKRAYDALIDPKKRAHFAQQALELRPRRKNNGQTDRNRPRNDELVRGGPRRKRPESDPQ